MDRDQRDRALPALTPAQRPWLYAITAGRAGEDPAGTLASIARAAAAGVDFIQIREKLLGGRSLFEFCRQARARVAGTSARLLVNDRWDIAVAARLDGVHLPAGGVGAARLRALSPPGLLIGQSCHSPAEVEAAEAADFCVLGPIFFTPSKQSYGPPLGLDALRGPFPGPVLALGGVTIENAAQCLAAGADGVAGIRFFAGDPSFAVTEIRRRAAGH